MPMARSAHVHTLMIYLSCFETEVTTMSRNAMVVLLYLALLAGAAQVCWPAPTVDLVAQTGHTNAIDALAFNSTGTLLASGGRDSNIKLWDIRSGSELRSLAGHLSNVTSLAFSRDGRTLVSGSLDATIKFWDVETGRESRSIRRPAGITSLAVSPDGSTLASAALDSELALWEFRTGNQIQLLRGHSKVVNSVSFSSDGRLLATASNDNSVRIWDLPSGREIRRILFPVSHSAPAPRDSVTGRPVDASSFNTDCVTSAIFSPDGRMLASVSYNLTSYEVNGIAFTITLWDVKTGTRIRALDTFMGGGPSSFIFIPDHNSTAGTMAFSPDGKSLLATGLDYTIKQWDVATGRLIKPLPVISWDDPQKAHETVLKFQAIRWDPPHLPTFGPDGRIAAIALENGIVIWDVNAPKQVQSLSARAAAVVRGRRPSPPVRRVPEEEVRPGRGRRPVASVP